MKVPVYSQEGQVVKEIELPKELFEIEVNKDLIYRSVTTYLHNQRQGTSSSKGRSEIIGSGKKPWRQKGTGRARAGTAKSPVWIGGGKSFGPKPRDFEKKLPKKMRKKALFSVLSLKASEDKVKVVEDFIIEQPKTKKIATVLKNLELSEKKCLFVLPEYKDAENKGAMVKSCRNIPTLETIYARVINSYTVLKNDNLLITPDGIKLLQEVFANA